MAPSRTATLLSSVVALGALVASSSARDAGCLDFIDLSHVPKCYQGSFLCLGEEDATCHKAENQLMLHVVPKGWDQRKDAGQFGFRFENEGPEPSRIQSIWVEDEYNLLKGLYSVAPLETSKGQKYRLVSNSSVFADALAHHVPFDQHFVVSCGAAQDWMGNSIRRGLRHVAGAAAGSLGDSLNMAASAPSPCVENSGANNRHDFVTLNFDSRCSLEDLEEAVALGLIRVGVQMTGFSSRPSVKGLITCQDMIEVEPFDPAALKTKASMKMFDFDEEQFWEEGDEDAPRQDQHHHTQQQA